MKSTREKILRTLLANPGSSIKALAAEVGINGISIRHHLSALEAENLISSTEERHGVGRPRLIYSLTEKGVEQFPTGYLRLTRRLLSVMKETFSNDQIKNLFEKIGEDIVEGYNFEPKNKTQIERLHQLQHILTKEGFIVEWERNEDSIILFSLSCPYYQIGLEHHEVCTLDHAMISAIFSEPIQIKTCIFEGDTRCTFEIQANPEKEEKP